ncbi:hypothetical protein MKW94_012522 [Papaver nudicaule]|uniref:Uncharacterized protein n=1 Tax=Papaver nudicaule TaxID=74823 RepID=A0AA41SAF9_PAPNU|nr:hypothetical protein [Papaver nudicaule]
MSNFTTHLVVALSLCLLLLGFSYSAEAVARLLVNDTEASTNMIPLQCVGLCRNDPECNNTCVHSGYGGGVCRLAASASYFGEQVDANKGKFSMQCCW